MRNFLTCILTCFMGLSVVYGQQSYQYSQYMLDKYEINPAYAGLEFSLNINAAVRSQWNGIPGNPKSQYISAHLPFYLWQGAIGIKMYNETSGAIRNVRISPSYNYVYRSNIGLISGGISLGIIQKSISGSGLVTPEGDYTDNSVNHNDPLLNSDDYAGYAPTWSIGAYLAADVFDIGITLSNMPGGSLSGDITGSGIGSEIIVYGEYRYAYSSLIDLSPSLLIRTDGIETQAELSVMGKYNGSIFGSIGVRGYSSRSLDALTFMIGTKVSPKYTVAYSFDTGLSDLRRANEGTHEFRVMYNLNRPIRTGLPPTIIYNPRHL